MILFRPSICDKNIFRISLFHLSPTIICFRVCVPHLALHYRVGVSAIASLGGDFAFMPMPRPFVSFSPHCGGWLYVLSLLACYCVDRGLFFIFLYLVLFSIRFGFSGGLGVIRNRKKREVCFYQPVCIFQNCFLCVFSVGIVSCVCEYTLLMC